MKFLLCFLVLSIPSVAFLQAIILTIRCKQAEIKMREQELRWMKEGVIEIRRVEC